jgi:spore maturation protein CgeB
MKILLVGPLWRGSNAGGLFRAISRSGCLIQIVDEFYYISLKTRSKFTKILERAVRPFQVKEFNDDIKSRLITFNPGVLLVYKGAFVQPETLRFARERGCKLALFYPDVSTTSHGPNIPASIPLYDIVFTTKTFGIRDMEQRYGVKNAHFIPHGFDPEIHRVIKSGPEDKATFGCDVSFIGTWSPKKEQWLSYLAEQLPDVQLKIWGDQWGKATSAVLKKSIQGKSVLGDLYALAIQNSKINLGILSEQIVGSSSGDLITSRTFHIPGAAGFMLHERNEESTLYFKEEEEAGFFDGPEEMVKKIREYLGDDEKRERVRLGGYTRAYADHSLDVRARTVIDLLSK